MIISLDGIGAVIDSIFSLLHPPSESHHVVPAIAGMVGAFASLAVVAAAPAPAAPDLASPDDVPADEQQKKEELQRRKLETAIMPEGVRTVMAGSDAPVWVYARMLSAASPEAPFEPNADLTEGILFRVERGGAAVVLGEKESVGDWVAVGVAVNRPTDGSPLPDAIRIAVERFSLTGSPYHRRTITLKVLQGS